MICLLIMGYGCSPQSSNSDIIALFDVSTGDIERNESIIALTLDDVTHLPATELSLYEVTDNNRIKTDFQISSTDRRIIYWKLEGVTSAGKTRKFELCREKPTPAGKHAVTIKQGEKGYEILLGDSPVLSYNSAKVYPPEGIEESYKRSGFIHPLHAPNGSVLTTIQPEDHYHHYGIWNPWTKTRFRDEEVDFWNLKKLHGTVRHAGIIAILPGRDPLEKQKPLPNTRR